MYKIDRVAFETKFIDRKAKIPFKHESNVIFRELPFTSRYKYAVLDFKGVVGAYARIIAGKELRKPVNQDETLEKIKDYVNFNTDESDAYQLSKMIKEMYFDENRELNLFSNQALLYTSSSLSDNKVAKFLFDVLNDGEVKESDGGYFEDEADNVLDELVYKILPNLEAKDSTNKEYMPLVPYVSNVFKEDFAYIMKDKNSIQKYMKKLLNYYYFFYISQLSIKLDAMFNVDSNRIEPLFFTVEWEKMSKSRKPYNLGWRKLEASIVKLFAHSKLLEMLNQNGEINHSIEDNITYEKIKRDVKKIETTSFGEDVKYLTQLYKENITDFNFDEIKYLNCYENEVLNDILYWFNCINGQFKRTGRSRAASGYSAWFSEYCKKNILKNRRSLGYTLNLKEEDIIFLTKICIKDEEKMKLKDLFSAFEQRGVMLDLKTKEEINSYYEKLNLIEKKSDSGDAQYVKRIL